MKIAFVLDSFTEKSNGTVVSAQRFAAELSLRGHEVRIVSIGVSGENMYAVKERKIPLVSKIAKKQGITFAKPDKAVLKAAFEGCDIVHFFLPWKLAKVGRKVAESMGIPATAAFHFQPENATYNLGLKHFTFINSLTYAFLRSSFFKHFDNIHCPSKFMADDLINRYYKSKLHIISNGILDYFSPSDEPRMQTEYFNILSVGRYAKEKRQDLLIKAIAKSKYKDKIRLVMAGRGPLEKKLRALAEKLLPGQVEFGFFDKPGLRKQIQECHLYVHCSEVEIECISCMEAFACGRVPVIARAASTATSQFALSENNAFKGGNIKEMQKRIDYWIEHTPEREEYEKKYAELGQTYRLDHSVMQFEQMLEQAIKDHKTRNIYQHSEKGKWMRKHFKRSNVIGRFFGNCIYYAFVAPVLFFLNKIAYGLRFNNRKGLKKLRKNGAVLLCNHVHNMDSTMTALAAFPRKITFTSGRHNFKMPVAGKLVKAFGAVPTPVSPQETVTFFYHLTKRIKNGKLVLFFPEGKLTEYSNEMISFKRGAFHLAVLAQVPVMPMVISYRTRPPKKNGKIQKPHMTLNVGEPIFPDFKLLKDEQETELMSRAEGIMRQMQKSYDEVDESKCESNSEEVAEIKSA